MLYHGTAATAIHYVGLVYLHKFTCLFIDRIELYIYIYIYIYKFHGHKFHLVSSGCQKKSYPGEIVPKRNRTQIEWVRFLRRNRTLGTISPEISYPG